MYQNIKMFKGGKIVVRELTEASLKDAVVLGIFALLRIYSCSELIFIMEVNRRYCTEIKKILMLNIVYRRKPS